MKILVINLLRTGDIIMLSPVISSLKSKFPTASISLLINRECEGVASLIKDVDQVHYFDRQKIQTSLGEVNRSLFEGFDRLEALVQQLNSANYDQVYNITQNKLSGLITGMIEAKEKFGLVIDSSEQTSFGSKWLQYLNDFEGESGVEPIHYSDIFQMAFALPRINKINFVQTPEETAKEKKILLQINTSDSKKNWNLHAWVEALENFNRFNKSYQFLVLSSPEEVEKNEEFADLCRSRDIHVNLLVCNLQKALEHMASASLLITLDTSIKHLASATSIPILEISLGSSDVRKTGAYRDHVITVQSKAECFPCAHSSQCTQVRHICSQSIPPTLVALLANCLIKKDFISIRVLAEEYEDAVQISRSHFNENGLWTSLPCSQNQLLEVMPKIIDRLSWLSVIESDPKRFKSIFIAQLDLILNNVRTFAEEIKLDFISQLSDYEMACSRAYGRLIVLLSDLRQVSKKGRQDNFRSLQSKLEDLVNQLQMDSRTLTLSRHLSSIYQGSSSYKESDIERTKSVLDVCLSRLQVEQRIIQVLTTNIGGEM